MGKSLFEFDRREKEEKEEEEVREERDALVWMADEYKDDDMVESFIVTEQKS